MKQMHKNPLSTMPLPRLDKMQVVCDTEKEADELVNFMLKWGFKYKESMFEFLNKGGKTTVYVSCEISWHNEFTVTKTAAFMAGVPIKVTLAEMKHAVTKTLRDYRGILNWVNLYGWRTNPELYKKPIIIDGKMIGIN